MLRAFGLVWGGGHPFHFLACQACLDKGLILFFRGGHLFFALHMVPEGLLWHLVGSLIKDKGLVCILGGEPNVPFHRQVRGILQKCYLKGK